MLVAHFTVDSLRRTCRSLLSEAGVAGIYDWYDYLDERQDALIRISSHIDTFI